MVKPKSLHIAIVGAGFAGLASAILLARAGHAVTVFEQFETAQSVGAGVLIQPSGLAAMRTLGILDPVLLRGAKIDALYGVNADGKPVIDIAYADWRANSFGLGLHRGVLFEALWDAAIAAGVTIKLGQCITTPAQLDAHSYPSAFDCKIVADGSHSTLRSTIGLPFTCKQYQWGALWAVLPDAE